MGAEKCLRNHRTFTSYHSKQIHFGVEQIQAIYKKTCIVGYYQTVESCMEGMLQHELKKSEATSIKELLEEIREISMFIKKEFGKARMGK